jgi:hypothetical protein
MLSIFVYFLIRYAQIHFSIKYILYFSRVGASSIFQSQKLLESFKVAKLLLRFIYKIKQTNQTIKQECLLVISHKISVVPVKICNRIVIDNFFQ